MHLATAGLSRLMQNSMDHQNTMGKQETSWLLFLSPPGNIAIRRVCSLTFLAAAGYRISMASFNTVTGRPECRPVAHLCRPVKCQKTYFTNKCLS